MIKTILVPVTGSDADSAAFAAAAAAAKPFTAHVNFLHVRVDAAALAVTMASEGGGSALVGGLVEQLDAEAESREKRARERFDQFCAREGLAITETPPDPDRPTAQWLRETGNEPFWVAEHGRAADLVVVGRPSEGEGVAPETLESALLDSGRPLLVPPATAITALPETIVIAWKATREAAHAMTAASPFLSLAKRVRILTVAEAADLPGEEGSQLMLNLRWRGIDVSAERLEPDERAPADRLLAAAAESEALLVMGGYGHSRLREWIFGGFTRHVLEAPASVPILMTH
jgi:nucleotide-binding universal stress UspA family protein